MRPDRIAKTDRWVAKPLCALLSGFERLCRPFRRPPSGEGPRRILFVKLIEMGSTVLACPAFAEAEKLVGRDNLYILVFAPNRVIVDVLPYFPRENVIAVDDRNVVVFAFSLLRSLIRVWRLRIDTAIDMEGLTSASALIMYLTRARRRVGFCNFTSQGPYRGRLMTRELSYGFQHHVSRQFLALVRAAAHDRREVPLLKERIDEAAIEIPQFRPRADELREVRRLVREGLGADPERIVLMNRNCSDLLPLCRWPDERCVEVGRRLLAEMPDTAIVLTGAPSEAEGAEALARQIGKRALVLAGRTTMRQLLVLCSFADLLVSNDSGPVHFAAPAPIPVVVLYGPETPVLYGPLSRSHRALSSELACSPCVSILNHRMSPCDDNVCMQQLAVEDVLAASRELLEG